MLTSACAVLVLAAGRGTRMASSKPKVLQPLAGRSMIEHVLELACGFGDPILVLSPATGCVAKVARAYLPAIPIIFQDPPRGTGDAVRVARDSVLKDFHGDVLVLYGDTPLLDKADIQRLFDHHHSERALITALGFRPADPIGLGRFITGNRGQLHAIAEDVMASSVADTALCNAGPLCIHSSALALLDSTQTHNKKGEFYLTDLIALADQQGHRCCFVEVDRTETAIGVNDRTQLAHAEASLQACLRRRAIMQGAHLIAPDTVYFAFDTRVSQDCVIEPFVVFGPQVSLGQGVRIRSFSHLEGVSIGQEAEIGPFARIRPGTVVDSRVRIGNFVEVKKTHLAEGAKANHLAYLGDAHIGAGTNIGAGTITCNFDGVYKHMTEIGKNSFIGSNVALVAPIVIGAGAMIGAGSVITEDVPDNALALERSAQKIRLGRKCKHDVDKH